MSPVKYWDLSKAFNMVEWTELFSSLLERGVEPVFLRVLLHVYQNQQCNVKWGDKFSQRFSVSNGVRQGAVSSPLLFSVSINDLFTSFSSVIANKWSTLPPTTLANSRIITD